MLVLSRKLNQEIVIDGDIVVKVMAIEGNRVKLGLTATRAVPIQRREIVEAVVPFRGNGAGYPLNPHPEPSLCRPS